MHLIMTCVDIGLKIFPLLAAGRSTAAYINVFWKSGVSHSVSQSVSRSVSHWQPTFILGVMNSPIAHFKELVE